MMASGSDVFLLMSGAQLPASFLATGPLTSQAQANRHLLDSSFSLTGPAQLILRRHVSGKQLETQ